MTRKNKKSVKIPKMEKFERFAYRKRLKSLEVKDNGKMKKLRTFGPKTGCGLLTQDQRWAKNGQKLDELTPKDLLNQICYQVCGGMPYAKGNSRVGWGRVSRRTPHA